MAASLKWLSGSADSIAPSFESADRRWLLQQALGLLFGAGLLWLVFENTQFDLTLSSLVFDAEARHFPAQHHWFFNDLMHHGLKIVSYVFAVPALALGVLGHLRGIDWLPPRQARLALLGSLLIPLATTSLKYLSNRHCPWDVIDFGGYAPYVHLLATPPENIMRGVCFPAGHASAGYVWLVWGLALRATRPVLAKRILLGAVLLGSLMGLARLFQGAHFLSHVLWSAWLAWALVIGLAGALRVPVIARN